MRTAVPQNRRRKWGKQIIGIGATLACLFIIGYRINFAEVGQAIRHFQWSFLVLGIASLTVDYALRISRWSIMLRAASAKTATFRNCCAPFLGSIALNNVLPLRLGDIVRALVFPSAMGVSRTTATSSLVMERLVDLMTLLACLAIGLFAVKTVSIPVPLRDTAISLSIVGGMALAMGFTFSGLLAKYFERRSQDRLRTQGDDRLAKALATIAGLLKGFQAMSRARSLLMLFLISMLIWAGESGLFYFTLLGLGMNASPTMALMVMSLATLATLTPSSPGYVGPFHLAAFAAVSLMGGTSAQAGSYAIITHLALWVPTTLAGAVAIGFRPELFRAVRGQPVLS